MPSIKVNGLGNVEIVARFTLVTEGWHAFLAKGPAGKELAHVVGMISIYKPLATAIVNGKIDKNLLKCILRFEVRIFFDLSFGVQGR